MDKDSDQLTRFFSNKALFILGVFSLLSCIVIAKYADRAQALGSIGAILGIFLCTLSARSAKSFWDSALVFTSLAVTFLFQFAALKLA
jgi:succinate-acetate transporter protein